MATLDEQIEALKGNTGLFVPIRTLDKRDNGLSTDEQARLTEITKVLSEHNYFFLGELAMEDPHTLNKSTSGSLSENDFAILSKVMQSEGFGYRAVTNHNFYYDEYRPAKTRSLQKEAGITRRDEVRGFLVKHFGSDALREPLKIVQSAHLNSDGLTAKFTLSADLLARNSATADTDLSETLGDSLKRVITRAWLQATGNSSLKTNDAHNLFSAKDSVNVSIQEGDIRVTIPLSATYRGAIEDGHIAIEALTESMNTEVKFALHNLR
ncbi:MAG: hypothetical protein GW903_02605 [Alphaproteobacteria bacterium]|nr:hypothetical protein [Alphaproteobacteria bacterium]NCQ87863.1 hypothetical protein [Alphaproteobacteria bacterium]NCT05629.1 hypothetical protein [Alphaproteobacteria bacterium]